MAEVLTSLRDSSVSSVAAGEFSNCFSFEDAAAFAFAFPFEPKDDAFFIKLFILDELQIGGMYSIVSSSLSAYYLWTNNAHGG